MKNYNIELKNPMVLVVLFLFGLIAIYTIYSPKNSNISNDNNVEIPETKDHSTAAFVKSKRFITQALKSPSTADFPFDDYKAINLGNDRYEVSSYVDSENSFGANIRSTWKVVLKYKGGPDSFTENWEVENMVIDNVQVYP